MFGVLTAVFLKIQVWVC